jgi:heme/copper-type cytochrome/quinol oxidase subunit 3
MGVTTATGGRSSKSPWAASLDMYRKVPGDLLEGSKEGRITSWIALLVMTWLFINETWAFLSTTVVPQLHLDSSKIQKFQIDFNITMLDLVSGFNIQWAGFRASSSKDRKRRTMLRSCGPRRCL